jgi:hypothetical protein
MIKTWVKSLFIFICALTLIGCSERTHESIVNSHAEAHLTKTNELQFRFKINEKNFNQKQVYQVKVSIHNEKLASALGTNEIIYGANTNYIGEFIEVKNSKENYIFMDPIPLEKDLHVFEIEDMIINEDAVSVEIFNEEEIIAKAFLTNFSSQL